MTSAAQTIANRSNSKLSTGPRTAEGKSRTKYNAVTHGYYATVALLPGERMEQWHSFCTAYVNAKAPADLPQILCVEQAALAEWRLIKLNYVEAKTCEEEAVPNQTLAEFQGEYTYEEDMWKKQEQRIENHLIRSRDKHLAQFRLHKKDKADASDEPRKAKTSRRRESVVATIPVAVQPDPEATSPIGAPAAEAASHSPEELARLEAIREETEKFREYLSTRRWGYSEAQISQEIQEHLIEIGLVVDSPQVEVN